MKFSAPQAMNQNGALTELAQESAIIDLTCSLPHGELTRLYRMIEATLPDVNHRIIQFVSAYDMEGAGTIAFELAVVAAQLVGKRVLFIDMGTAKSRAPYALPEHVGTPLDSLLLTGRPPQEAIARAAGTDLYFTRLRQRGEDGFPAAPLNALEIALMHLRPFFDLIIIDSQAVLKDNYGIALASLVDGSVLVVEAERTRAPVAAECRRQIEAGGGRVIGAVLNKRRFYIPRFLYRLLYPHSA